MMIYGIDDDVVLVCGFVAFACAAVLIHQQRNAPQQIHPSQEAWVSTVRRQLSSGGGRAPDARPAGPSIAERRATRANAGDDCPICLSALEFHCETNCGHSFCAACLQALQGHSAPFGTLTCPCCRQRVTLILKSFSLADSRSPQCVQWSQWIDQYNRRHSGDYRGWLDYLRDTPTLLRHLYRDIWSGSGIELMFRLRVLVLISIVILYFLSPLDIIPEAVFGVLGFLDDLLFALILLVYLSIIYRSVVIAR